jgi:MoaA/NifB/PqqE/SkfB family radical SAM enzyme
MRYDLLSRLLSEAWEMGTRLITVSGGEPLIYRHLFRMLEEFDGLTFMMYTNATLIDEEMADRIAAAGNLWPAISVEGFGEDTDRRRGAGVHDKVLRGMQLLRERGVMFGFSATPTRRNSDIIASDEFIDYYLDKGALFGWLFQYLPMGKDPDLGLMCTPAQREQLRAKTKEWQVSKPLFLGDFWNDGACVGGCLSANRYCYITPEGKVQPCTFVHFYTHDLNECTLRDVLRSKLFRSIRTYPRNRNLLRPCKIIDNPEALRRRPSRPIPARRPSSRIRWSARTSTATPGSGARSPTRSGTVLTTREGGRCSCPSSAASTPRTGSTPCARAARRGRGPRSWGAHRWRSFSRGPSRASGARPDLFPRRPSSNQVSFRR